MTPTGALAFDVVEVLGCDEGYFAEPTEAAPVPGAGTVAITLEAAAFEGGRHLYAFHPCTTFWSKEYAFHYTRHYQPSFWSCSSASRGFPVSWESNIARTFRRRAALHIIVTSVTAVALRIRSGLRDGSLRTCSRGLRRASAGGSPSTSLRYGDLAPEPDYCRLVVR